MKQDKSKLVLDILRGLAIPIVSSAMTVGFVFAGIKSQVQYNTDQVHSVVTARELEMSQRIADDKIVVERLKGLETEVKNLKDSVDTLIDIIINNR